jgi:hypothetical protein
MLGVHQGAPKMWYGVASQDAAAFKQACGSKWAKKIHDIRLQLPPSFLRCVWLLALSGHCARHCCVASLFRRGYDSVWDTVSRGISCGVGYHVAWDTMPCGIPCSVRYHAAWDTMPCGIPCNVEYGRGSVAEGGGYLAGLTLAHWRSCGAPCRLPPCPRVLCSMQRRARAPACACAPPRLARRWLGTAL